MKTRLREGKEEKGGRGVKRRELERSAYTTLQTLHRICSKAKLIPNTVLYRVRVELDQGYG